jgi:hypothetical protein
LCWYHGFSLRTNLRVRAYLLTCFSCLNWSRLVIGVLITSVPLHFLIYSKARFLSLPLFRWLFIVFCVKHFTNLELIITIKQHRSNWIRIFHISTERKSMVSAQSIYRFKDKQFFTEVINTPITSLLQFKHEKQVRR